MSEALAALNMAEAREFSELVSVSTLVPAALHKKPADIFIIVLTGQELGIGPMQSLRCINVIQGRPAPDASLLVALAKRHGQCRYFRMVSSDETQATYETHREGSPEPETMKYTVDQAQKAGLNTKDIWRKHGEAMLRARASSALARAVYPDATLGLYAREEMTQEMDQARDVQDAEFVEKPVERPVDSVTAVGIIAKVHARADNAWIEPKRAPVEDRGPLDTWSVPVTAVGGDPPPVEDKRTRGKPTAGLPEVPFPTEDPRDTAHFEAERLRVEKLKVELHEMVNNEFPGDENKVARVAAYKSFGLLKANPILQYMKMDKDEQERVLKLAREWKARRADDVTF